MVGESRASALVFIPAFNEEDTVGDVVRSVREEVPHIEVLVVDDGSSDRTARRAREAGATVAAHPFNVGLGAALQTGYLYARRNGYRCCAHMDADGQHRPQDVRRLLDAVREGNCDLAIGSRYHGTGNEEPADNHATYVPTLVRRAGIGLFRRLLSLITRHRFTDTTSGLRAANRPVILAFASDYAGDYPELESAHRLIRQGLRIQEFPVTMLPRAGGKSKFNALNSAYFVFKGLLVLFVGMLRDPKTEPR